MDHKATLRSARLRPGKPIVKLGTVRIGVVETTPVVWQGRLLRMEWIRNHGWGRTEGVTQELGYFQFCPWDGTQALCPPLLLTTPLAAVTHKTA